MFSKFPSISYILQGIYTASRYQLWKFIKVRKSVYLSVYASYVDAVAGLWVRSNRKYQTEIVPRKTRRSIIGFNDNLPKKAERGLIDLFQYILKLLFFDRLHHCENKPYCLMPIMISIDRVPSHRSGKSGKILKTFSSQGNQGKTGFSAKIREKIFESGNFFQNYFQTF